MKKLLLFFLIIVYSWNVNAQVVGWDVSSASGYGISPLTPTISNTNVTVVGLTRGSGVVTTGTAAGRAWGGLGWNYSTASAAIAANAFITFSVKPNTGYNLSLTAINPFSYRRSGTGAVSALIQYQVNSGGFNDISTLSLASSAASGATLGPIDLSTISALQNLPTTSIVTFRIVPFSASGAGGTFYIFDVANSTANDLAITGTVTQVSNPTITLNPTTLNAFTTTQNTPSATQSYTVTGANLSTDITVSAPTGFEISQTSATSGFATTQTLTQTSGSVAATTIYARLTGASLGTPSGDITHVSGTASQNMAVTGTVANQPVITVTPTSLSGFSTTEGTPSAEQSYTVSGVDLTGNIVITPPTGVEISQTSGSGFTNTITLIQTSGSVVTTTIYARLTGGSAGAVSGDIAHASTGATTQNVAISGSVTALPLITVSPSSLSGFTTIEGTPSTTQNYTVSGANLTADISILAPSGFTISTNAITGFGSSLTLTQIGGSIASTTIFVRLTGIAQGTPSGDISHTSTGAVTKNVAVDGTVNANNTPTISVTPTTLSGFSTIVGTPSATQTYSVSAVNLSTDLIITAPTGVEISQSANSGFMASLTLNQSSGVVAATTIYVRLTGAAVNTVSGNITNASTGATAQNVAISGEVVPQPSILVTPTSLSGFSTFVGTASTTQTYTVSGSDLTADISVTAPTGFEISTASNSGFGASLTLTQISGSVASTTIYVRLKGTSVGTPSGNISHTSTNANTKDVAVSGSVNAIPVITISGTPLSAFSTSQGTPSVAQQYSVSGANLTNDIVLTAPTGFEIRTGMNAYAATLTLTQTGGSIAVTTIDVRLTGVNFGAFSGNISHASTDATTQNVAVSGTVVELATSIGVVRSTIPAQNSYTGSPVRIKGKVTGIFGNNKFYVSDVTGGIAIFQTNIVSANSLAFGDSVNVKGTTARFNGEAELLTITSITKLTAGTAPTPKIFDSNNPPAGVSLNQFLADNEGDFVKITSVNINATGTFATSRNYSILACNNQGGSEIRIDAAASTFATANNVVIPSATQDITGVVGHFITANGGTDKLQLFPRTTTDLSNSAITCPLSSGVGGCGVASATDNPQTLDVVTWNVEWLGHPQNGPSQSGTGDALQITNAQTIMSSIGADVFMLQEICQYNTANPSDNATAFGKLIQGLNTAFGANAYSGECSPAVSGSVPDSNPQRVCIIYKNSVVTKISGTVMFNGFTPATYPTTPSQFWASGRKPYVFKAEVNLNGKVDTINFVGLHAKSGSDAVSYARRAYDVRAMYDTLQTYYPMQKVIVGGDLNDDLDVSIFPNNISSYSPFLYTNPDETSINGTRPNASFDAVTKVLSDARCASTASFPDFIDHFIVSNELTSNSPKFNYVGGSATNIQPYSLVANYATTTSDHFPTLIRLRSQPCPSKPVISPASPAICLGNSTTLTANCAGGTLNWTGGLTGSSITVSPTETKSYKVACTVVDCTSDSSDVATITVKPIPTKPTITPNATLICGGGSVSLFASGCSGGTLNWTGGLSGLVITVSPTATKEYKAACTINGCTSDSSNVATVTVSPKPAKPIISPSSPSICVGSSSSVTLTSTACEGGILYWTDGLFGTSISVSPSADKTYKVACMIMGCVSDSSDAVTVTVTPIPAAPTLTATPSSIVLGQTSSLSATGCAGTVTWSLGGSTANPLVITPNATATYTATCTINSCVSPVSTSVTVIVTSTEPCQNQLNLVSTADDYSSGVQLKQASSTNGKITATNKITGTAISTYQAKVIELNAGFKADAGTVFKAEVGGCN